MDKKPLFQRITTAAGASIGDSLRTARFLLAVMVPLSLAVTLLNASGVLHLLAARLDPFMGYIGLPGESSIVFLSAVLLNNYSAIAVIGTLSLGAREVIILAVMCLIAHSLVVECAIMKKTGSSVMKMAVLRVAIALIAAYFLNKVLPANTVPTLPMLAKNKRLGIPLKTMPDLLWEWALSSGQLVLQIMVLVSLLMLVQKMLEESGLLEALSRVMKPLMMVFGLPLSTSFLWIISNVIGFAYGSAIIMERMATGKIPSTEADLFNHHAAISHSLFEDTIVYTSVVYAATGSVSMALFWLLIPRTVLAIIVVWTEKLRRALFRRSFRVGTMK